MAATATLTLKGKEMKATILSPAGAEFSVESAEQKPRRPPIRASAAYW